MATATAEAQRTKSVAGDGIKRRKGTQLSQQGKKRVTSFAQKARSLHRLLEHRKDLPEDVQAKMRSEADSLQQLHRQRLKELKRQKFIRAKKALYSKLKFFELKKVQRRLHQTRKELLGLLSQQERMRSSATPSDDKNSALSTATPETEEWQALAERIADAQRRLRLHLDDLNYIRLYPVDEPYVALFPAQDTEDSQEKRKAMRLRIFQMLVESRQGEDGKSDDEAGGDDMFVDVQGAAEDEATLADPFEEAHPLSDSENDKGRGGAHRLKSKGPQAKPTSHPHNNARTTGNDARRRQGNERVARGPRAGSCVTSKQQLSKPSHRALDRRSTQQKAFQLHEQKAFQHKRSGKEGSGRSPKEIQQQRDGGSTAASKGLTSQPTRIGLSKHKAPNQHLMFDSDEE